MKKRLARPEKRHSLYSLKLKQHSVQIIHHRSKLFTDCPGNYHDFVSRGEFGQVQWVFEFVAGVSQLPQGPFA
jgi:hypothetical protein